MKLTLFVGILFWLMATNYLPISAANKDSYEEEHSFLICPKEKQTIASTKLAELVKLDQQDRQSLNDNYTPEAGYKISKRDQLRLAKVAAIFAEGCINSGSDYYNAALIFQHGEHPDHFYQTWLWADKAVKLGSEDASWLISRSVDRFLMSNGYKQLFGTQTQFTFPSRSEDAQICIWPIEEAFLDENRKRHGAKPLFEILEQYKKYLKQFSAGETEVPYCQVAAANPPKGIFSTIW